MDEYNKHYILTDEQDNITDSWSDGLYPNRDTTGAICISDRGGYQFRLFTDGKENPEIRDENGVYLYRYIDGVIIAKTPEEIAVETPEPEPPKPSDSDRLAAVEGAVLALMMGGAVNV